MTRNASAPSALTWSGVSPVPLPLSTITGIEEVLLDAMAPQLGREQVGEHAIVGGEQELHSGTSVATAVNRAVSSGWTDPGRVFVEEDRGELAKEGAVTVEPGEELVQVGRLRRPR